MYEDDMEFVSAKRYCRRYRYIQRTVNSLFPLMAVVVVTYISPVVCFVVCDANDSGSYPGTLSLTVTQHFRKDRN